MADSLAEALPLLEAHAAGVADALAASGARSVLAGRAEGLIPEAWVPHYLITLIPPAPHEAQRLAALGRTGHLAAGYLVAGDLPGAAWTWEVTPDGRLPAPRAGPGRRGPAHPARAAGRAGGPVRRRPTTWRGADVRAAGGRGTGPAPGPRRRACRSRSPCSARCRCAPQGEIEPGPGSRWPPRSWSTWPPTRRGCTRTCWPGPSGRRASPTRTWTPCWHEVAGLARHRRHRPAAPGRGRQRPAAPGLRGPGGLARVPHPGRPGRAGGRAGRQGRCTARRRPSWRRR